MEDREDAVTMHADAELARIVGQLVNELAADRPPFETRQLRPEVDRGLLEAKMREREEARLVQHEPRADGHRRCEPLEDRDLPSLLLEQSRDRETGNAGADHCDGPNLVGGSASSLQGHPFVPPRRRHRDPADAGGLCGTRKMP